jgi:6-phosphogluconolactonase (cycloisomerase 2 family)
MNSAARYLKIQSFSMKPDSCDQNAPAEEVGSRGLIPGAFGIDPTGAYLFAANQASEDIVPFLINQNTGRLALTRQVIQVSSPSCVTFAEIK